MKRAAGVAGANEINGCNSLTAEQTALNGELDGLHSSVASYWSDVSYGKFQISSSYELYDVGGSSTYVMSLVSRESDNGRAAASTVTFADETPWRVLSLYSLCVQGLFEAITQNQNVVFGTGSYVLDQCEAAAIAHAGSANNLVNNYWTYVCGYPFTNVDGNGVAYDEGFTGLANVGNQGNDSNRTVVRAKEAGLARVLDLLPSPSLG